MNLKRLVEELRQHPDSWYSCSVCTGPRRYDPRLSFLARIIPNGGKHGTPHLVLDISGGKGTCPLSPRSNESIFNLTKIGSRGRPQYYPPMSWTSLVQHLSKEPGSQFLVWIRTGHRKKDPRLGLIISPKEGGINLGISVDLSDPETLFLGGDPDQDIFEIHLSPAPY